MVVWEQTRRACWCRAQPPSCTLLDQEYPHPGKQVHHLMEVPQDVCLRSAVGRGVLLRGKVAMHPVCLPPSSWACALLLDPGCAGSC